MKDWERHANEALRALGDAYHEGRIGLDTYRERRRRLIASFRDRQEVTARRELPATAGAAARERDALPMLLGSPWASAARWGLLLVLLAALVAVALVLLSGAHGHG